MIEEFDVVNIAVIEDDQNQRDEFVEWLSIGIPEAKAHIYETLHAAEEALRKDNFDLIILDIELGINKNAGIELMRLIDHLKPPPPVIVVSGLTPEHYRGVTKALGAWDFLQKPCLKHDFVAIVNEALEESNFQESLEAEYLEIDPLSPNNVLWKKEKVNITLTQMKILNLLVQRKGDRVKYQEFFPFVKSGKSVVNIRKHVNELRNAFKDVDSSFSNIKTEPQYGFSWIGK